MLLESPYEIGIVLKAAHLGHGGHAVPLVKQYFGSCQAAGDYIPVYCSSGGLLEHLAHIVLVQVELIRQKVKGNVLGEVIVGVVNYCLNRGVKSV